MMLPLIPSCKQQFTHNEKINHIFTLKSHLLPKGSIKKKFSFYRKRVFHRCVINDAKSINIHSVVCWRTPPNWTVRRKQMFPLEFNVRVYEGPLMFIQITLFQSLFLVHTNSSTYVQKHKESLRNRCTVKCLKGLCSLGCLDSCCSPSGKLLQR